MAGPPGIGKTQVSLQFMIHLALGKDFLHYKIAEPKKICFLSLEMGHGELKIFLDQMNEVLNDAERALLEENFIIVPHGESWALNTPEGQEQLNVLLDAVEPYGLFVDSIGSAIIGNISSDETVQPLLNYTDRLRNSRGMFVWYIHHTRKQERGGNGSYSQDDIYGNQYLAARPSSIYGVLPGKGGTIKMRSFKVRLAAKESDYLLERKDHLTFEKVSKAVDDMLDNNLNNDDKPDKAPGGFDL
jgi:RecA-family ATPase